QLRKLKQKHPRLKALISLGGWTESNYFSDIALTADSRRAFVRACINRFIRGNLPFDPDTGTGGPRTAAGVFDGIDIDWEYPARQGEGDNSVRPDDRRNVTLLFREFRRQLDALGAKTGRRYLLTAAVPAARTAGASYELRRVGSILDWLNVMTYDFHGTWETRTNFNSPFGHDPADPNGSHWLTVKGTIDYLLSRGVPPDRLVVGVPFYGTAFLRAPSVNHGLFQVYSNAGLGSAPGWLNHANPTYRELVDVGRVVTEPTDGSPPVGQRKFTRYWNARAGEPWLWRPRMKIGDSTVSVVVTYPDPASLAQRVRLVRRLGLRGMMCWELSEDSASGALGRALAEVRKR
ncbi:MAG TPA: glycosyl hydrolase family 18 protein, partial [Candidatus Limnocylindria bacterium]|nr:glycosyl hydrolase family 18 protein [Candidatus Limnocylindria bacterium]